ncbi:MAG TPA: hypothetical protein VFC59_04510, partial [Cryobacterium sp.]|nr:hypothetical protein [Cryobacterium sp.]
MEETDAQPRRRAERAGGLAAFFARHRTGSLTAAGAVVFALLGTGAVVAGAATRPPILAAASEATTPTP